MDVNRLTPNDYRALRARMGEAGMDLDDTLTNGHREDVVQTLILGFKLREDPGLTWEQAGALTAAEVFDLDDTDAEPDPQTGGPGSPGPAPAAPAAGGSRPRRPAAANAPSS